MIIDLIVKDINFIFKEFLCNQSYFDFQVFLNQLNYVNH